MPKALAIAEEALIRLDAALIDETWTENFEIPANTVGRRRVKFGDCIYILADASKEDSRFVIVDVDILAKLDSKVDTSCGSWMRSRDRAKNARSSHSPRRTSTKRCHLEP